MENIEVETRIFISDDEYDAIKDALDNDSKFVGKLEETTIYFSGAKDLRMRKDQEDAFIIMKEGKMHDECRQELEVRISREDFDDMVGIFQALGYAVEIKWFRKRLAYENEGIRILLDDTKGYGKILELEKLAEKGQEKKAYAQLEQMMKRIGFDRTTPKDEFDQRFEYYKKNWKELTR